MPCARKRSAVRSPIAATFASPSARASRAARARAASKNASTPFCDVKTTHANDASVVDRRVGRRADRRAVTIAIVGAYIGLGAAFEQRAREAPDCSPVRVIGTRLPKSGVASNQRSASRSARRSPTTTTAGAPTLRALDLVGDRRERSDARSAAWDACPRATTATGVVGASPFATSSRGDLARGSPVAIKKTSVRFGSASFAQSSVDAGFAGSSWPVRR